MKRKRFETTETQNIRELKSTQKNLISERLTMQSVGELKLGDLNAADLSSTAAISHNPKNGYAYTIRGEVKLRQGDLSWALADSSKAIELIPNSYAYKTRSMVKCLLGDLGGAIADADKLIEYNPTTVILVFEVI